MLDEVRPVAKEIGHVSLYLSFRVAPRPAPAVVGIARAQLRDEFEFTTTSSLIHIHRGIDQFSLIVELTCDEDRD